MPLYIDPTSGGMVLQVLLSGFVGVFVFLKVFWRNVLNLVPFRRSNTGETPADETDDTTSVA